MQKLRESDTEVLYRVNSPAELTAQGLEGLVSLEKTTRIEWPRQVAETAEFLKLAPFIYAKFGMEANPVRFDQCLCHLPALVYDVGRAKASTDKTFEQGYSQIWRAKLPPSFLERERTTVVSLANAQNTRFIELDGRLTGMILADAFETYRGIKENYLGWIWIDPELTQPVRKAVGASLLNSAATLLSGNVLAAVYAQNLKSFKFLRRAGFETFCVQLTLLR